MIGKHWSRFLVVQLLVSLVVAAPRPASADTQTTGTIIVQADLTVQGLTTMPVGTVPDLTQFWTWPSRGWQLSANTYWNPSGTCVAYRPPSTADDSPRIPSLCAFAVSGGVWGWCDLSKGAGSGGYGSYTQPESASINSFRWTGSGATLAVTGEMTSSLWPSSLANTVFGKVGSQARGTFTGTMTLLHGAATPSLGCFDPNGLQSIPVVLELEYVLS
jgi:hypothetical protein